MPEDLKDLERRVKERKEHIDRILKFVLRILPKHGKTTKREVRSSNTNVVWELDLVNFHFKGNFSQNALGGNFIVITYEDTQVFEVYYQSNIKEYSVSHYVVDQTIPWQCVLDRLMKNFKSVLSSLKHKKKERSQEEKKKEKEEQKTKKLYKEAMRLGVVKPSN